MSLADDATEIFRHCVVLYEAHRRGLISADSAPVDSLRSDLKEVVAVKARARAAANNLLEVASEFPGYLIYNHSNVRIFFPWLIVDDLPPKEILDYLIRLATKIKACSMSFTCLSGSTLYFNSLRSISDIDFLEYEVNPELDPPRDRASVDLAVVKRRPNYIEYVTETPFYGAVEVTNKLVEIDTKKTGLAAAPESSAFQEAPLVGTPRELYDPIALGEYIRYLARDTLTFFDKRPAKIAKRLLPLSRIIEDRKISESILNAFDNSSVQGALRVKQKLDLISKLRTRKEEPLERIKGIAQQDIEIIRNTKGTPLVLSEQEDIMVTSLTQAIKHVVLVNYEKLEALSFV